MRDRSGTDRKLSDSWLCCIMNGLLSTESQPISLTLEALTQLPFTILYNNLINKHKNKIKKMGNISFPPHKLDSIHLLCLAIYSKNLESNVVPFQKSSSKNKLLKSSVVSTLGSLST